MPKKLVSLITLLVFSLSLSAQGISPADLKALRLKEDSLKKLSLKIIQGRTSADRFSADSHFTKMFVRALKIKNSIQYPFDSLVTISRLAPSDGSFKIYTWQMMINDNVTRQHGAIQMKTTDGSLKLFPLIDKSESIVRPGDTIANHLDWYGAVYYKMIEKEAFGRKYYTLLGYDENNIKSNKKIVEVLSFYDREPVFGGSYFSFKTNSLRQNFGKRFIMEYKKNASPRLTYDPDQDMVIFEHLVSETGELNKKWTYIPDGDYEGLKWVDGKWVHVEKVYDFKLEQGKEPVPQPLRDDKGNLNQDLLKDNGHPDEDPVQNADSPSTDIKLKEEPKKKK